MNQNVASSGSSPREISSLALKYAAGAAALVGAGQAQGAVVVTPINTSWNADSRYFKFENFLPEATEVTVGISDSSSRDLEVRFATAHYAFVGGNPSAGHTVKLMALPNGAVSGFAQKPLISYGVGDAITGATVQDYGFIRVNHVFAPGWADDTPSAAGFSLTFGGNTYYGWLDVTTDVETLRLTVGSIAINTTPGQSIISPIPEPAHSVFAFAAGALGIAALRRRRGEASAA